MYGHACASRSQVSAAGIANTSAPAVSATAVVTCVSSAPATSAFQSAWSAAEVSTKMSAAVLTGGEASGPLPGPANVNRGREGERGSESRSRTISLGAQTNTIDRVRAPNKGGACRNGAYGFESAGTPLGTREETIIRGQRNRPASPYCQPFAGPGAAPPTDRTLAPPARHARTGRRRSPQRHPPRATPR